MQERIKEHDRDMLLARTQTSAVSEYTHETGHYPIWNEVKFLDREPHWYTRRVKEPIHIDFTLITLTGIMELKFLKHGCPRSKSTTTGERYNSGPLREQLLVGTMEQWEDRNAPITADLCDINDTVQSVDLIA